MTGWVQSDEQTFPVKVGPDLTHNDGTTYDCFVAKVNAAGTGLGYCGYIGGDGSDVGSGIAVDASGNLYVTGGSYANWGTPVTAHAGGQDAFIA